MVYRVHARISAHLPGEEYVVSGDVCIHVIEDSLEQAAVVGSQLLSEAFNWQYTVTKVERTDA